MTADAIGTRGEAIFCVLITQFCGRDRPLFKPTFLGEKFETLDYLIELVGAGDRRPFLFVQVKTTRRGYTRRGRRLKARISTDDIRRLASYLAPTYVVGIDEPTEAGFIVSANEAQATRISSLTTKFPLDCHHLELLWREVNDYWRQRDMTLHGSAFKDTSIEPE